MPNKKDVITVSQLDLFDPLKKKLLEGVSFSLREGEALRIIGENGVGKTTLLSAIFSDYRGFRGSIELKTKDFSFLPQLSPRRPKLPITLKEICDKEYEFFQADTMKRSLGGASGGERKRAMLAKVFSENKKLMALDEPLNHLDQNATVQVGRWLQGYLDRGGSLIYTGHTGNLPQTKALDLEKWKC